MYYALSYISNWECWSSKEIEMKLFEFHVAFNYFEDWRWIRIRDLWTNASRRVLCYISNWKSRSKSNNSSSFFNHFEDWRTRARYDICKCIALASFVTFLIKNLDRNRIIRASSSFRTPLRSAKKRGIEKSPSKSNRIFIFLSNHFGANAGRARDDTYSQKQWHCLMPVHGRSSKAFANCIH